MQTRPRIRGSRPEEPPPHTKNLRWLWVAGLLPLGVWLTFVMFSTIEENRQSETTRTAREGQDSATFDPSAQSAPEALETPDDSAPQEAIHSSVLILRISDQKPAEGTTWIFEQPDRVEAHTVSTGQALSIPKGHWSIKADSPAWCALRSSVTVRPSETVVVWVSKIPTYEFLVTSEDGAAVPGAEIYWMAKKNAKEQTGSWEERRSPNGITDKNGQGRIRPRHPIGSILIVADGFRRESVSLHGQTESPTRITLVRQHQSTLTVLDKDSTPLDATKIGTPLGALRGATTASGEIDLPSYVTQETPLKARCEGYSETEFTLASLEKPLQLVLAEAGTIEIQALNIDNRPAAVHRWFVELVSPPAFASGFPVVRRDHFVSNIGQSRWVVPLQSKIRCSVFLDQNRYWEEEIQILEKEQTAILRPESGESLDIRCETPDGHPGSWSVEVFYDHNALKKYTLHPNEHGLVRISLPNHVRAFMVRADDCVARHFNPAPHHEVRTGELVLNLEWGEDLLIRLRDREGAPVPGSTLRIVDQRGNEASLRHPTLFGGWLSGLPGWIEVSRLAFARTTNVKGEVKLRSIAPGLYEVAPRIPRILYLDHPEAMLYRPIAWEGSVPETQVVDLLYSKPRRVQITTRDGLSGTPLSSVSVRLPGSAGSGSESKGFLWTGWVNDETRQLLVVASGYGPELVDLPASPDSGPATIDVDLFPTAESRLSLVGSAAADLAGQKLSLTGIWKVDQGRGQGAQTQIWAGKARVDDTGAARFAIPTEHRNVAVRIQPIETATARYKFYPNTLPWSPGEDFRVEVKREPREKD